MNTIKNIFIAFFLLLAITSCTKKDKEIPLAEPNVSSSDFDLGYLGIRMEGNSSANSGNHLDTIVYTNLTKGTDFTVKPSLIVFVPSDTSGAIGGRYSKHLRTGNTGDSVRCCIYVNTPLTISIVFSRTANYSNVSLPVGKYCFDGFY